MLATGEATTTAYLHVVHFCQPDAELTTGAPSGLRCVAHTNYKLFFFLQSEPNELPPCCGWMDLANSLRAFYNVIQFGF